MLPAYGMNTARLAVDELMAELQRGPARVNPAWSSAPSRALVKSGHRALPGGSDNARVGFTELYLLAAALRHGIAHGSGLCVN